MGERDWPEGRGIFHNKEKTFLVWVNEEDQLRIISMQMGGNVKEVFERLARGISAVQESVKAESGKDFLMSDFPEIKSKHSLVAKYVTPELWAKLSGHETATSGFTLAKAIACAVEFDDQHCGIYAGDADSYIDFAEVFDPLIQDYHGI